MLILHINIPVVKTVSQSKGKHSVPPIRKGSQEKKLKGEMVSPIVPITAAAILVKLVIRLGQY